MALKSSLLAAAASLAVALSFGAVRAQTLGPISAAEAKAANAITKSVSACIATCKARGNVQPQTDCAAKWCVSGQCYRNRYEVQCIK